MTEPRREAERAVSPLFTAEEDQLFAELGIRARALANHPAAAGSFDPDVTYNAAEMGAVDEMRAVGRRLFERWNRELYDIVCGNDPDDSAGREDLGDALGAGQTPFAAYLATLIVSSLGLAPALATVAAVIVVKRFFNPALDEFCQTWAKSVG